MVADGKRALVMSLNLTHAGLTTNREYAIADSDPIDVGDAVAIFAADRSGLLAPAPCAQGRLLASPANARARLGDLIAGARRSLAIEIEELSDPRRRRRASAPRRRAASRSSWCCRARRARPAPTRRPAAWLRPARRCARRRR